MKKYLRNITVGTALVLVAGSCTGNFEEYNTNQFQIRSVRRLSDMCECMERH